MAGLTLHKKFTGRASGRWGGALLVTLVGWALLAFPFGQSLTSLSYDLPVVVRAPLASPDIVMVYVDAASRTKFQLPSGLIDRRRHLELLRRLTSDGARLIFFDIIFQADVPGVDPEFAAAIRQHGNVVLGYHQSLTSQASSAGPRGFIREAVRPNRLLREAAQHSGLLEVEYPDAGRAVRKIFTGDNEAEAAVWSAARALRGGQALGNRLDERWLNFYGPNPAFSSVSLSAALEPNDVPPDFFHNKIVFVGFHPDDLSASEGQEKFATPWTRFGHAFAPGVDILATSVGNLIQGNWLRRIPTGAQLLLLALFGAFIGITLASLRPWPALGVAAASVALITAVSVWVNFERNVWWSWMIPVAVQTPLAFVWSVACQYTASARRERRLRQAFSSYLSPHLVQRIVASDFDLSLGGKELDATILFTDLEGFTSMAESLPPQEVSRILTEYFAQITRHIFENEGTIIKYVGDSVMAVWGAPLPDQRQSERAVRAAEGIRQASPTAVPGRRLRTRIGINSGKALAGNLGSPFRFDYTVIGATTNLASRLERLNKVLKTDILISESTRQQLPADIPTRYLGRFLLRGTTQPVAVYEVLERVPDFASLFAKAVQACEAGDFATARSLFEQISDDGPTRYYLEELRNIKEARVPFVLVDS